jgi:pantothenate kinase
MVNREEILSQNRTYNHVIREIVAWLGSIAIIMSTTSYFLAQKFTLNRQKEYRNLVPFTRE